ncbi:MAG TPA: glycosyltransferase family 4 protein [Bryobacteraceae bacterium]|nr:glycosyltransferase family 4 protein [Bryobacteraceae bacterium]
MKVLYTAAHGGFAGEHAPLGGGAAVCDMLTAEWTRTRPFDFELFTPASATGHEIVRFDTVGYARFSREFEAASTAAIRSWNPKQTVVLVNDIAEGPDFRSLSAEGYRLATVWHVDVVAYIASIYCRDLLAPESLTSLHRRLGGIYPDVLQLIFQKQADCVHHSAAHFVPSPAMKEIIVRCYPLADPHRIHVLPWGAPPVLPTLKKEQARRALGVPDNALVLLTLSRLSPEKNQQLLLDALAEWESRPGFPTRPVYAVICGGAAYMHGQKHAALLRKKAARLRKTKVLFPGHVHGQQKQNYFSAADLYVFPSRHESYGLTLMEAFRYGLPALTLDHAGARAVMRPGFGAVAEPATFLDALQSLAASDLRAKGAAARSFAESHPFSQSAATLAAALCQLQFE